MTKRTRLTTGAVLFALLPLLSPHAVAAHYTFSFTSGAISASGKLDTADYGGVEIATSGSLSFGSWGNFALVANPNAPATANSPYNFLNAPGYPAFFYDNAVYPAATPTLDNWGLLFENTADQYELNIFGNGVDANGAALPYSALIYESGWDGYLHNGNWYIYTDNAVTDFRLSAVTVPEPATLALFGIAFAALGCARRRRA